MRLDSRYAPSSLAAAAGAQTKQMLHLRLRRFYNQRGGLCIKHLPPPLVIKKATQRWLRICFELLMRLELTTSSLPRKCSTTELQQQQSLEERGKSRKQNRINQTFSLLFIFLTLKFNIPTRESNPPSVASAHNAPHHVGNRRGSLQVRCR